LTDELTEPREEDLPPKPPVEIPDDDDEVPGDEEVPESEEMDNQEAADNETVDNTEEDEVNRESYPRPDGEE
jgi:hypothetical protein